MNGARDKLSLVLIAGVLPLFLILVLITPLWIYFTGESFFISTLLKLAEVQNDDLAVSTVSPLRQILLLAILYLPAGLFAFAIWQGMSVTRQVRQKQILSRALANSVRNIAIAMLSLGIALPVCRFLIPLAIAWPGHYYQVTLLLGDFVLLLTGGLLLVTFHSLVEGIKAEEENKEFI
ncbi:MULTISPECIES: DUF2975 domain-containing protein [Enterobacter]|uniref:DUF2975 domain-containing protein n=1 Tax=Enterobacter TaxID=547 RepID=UPI000863886D|nr:MULTISPECIES: DUF2975 domain-containing protein [Enterobacter]SHG14498.1 Protein of unknown function [Pantoea sesami]AOL11772.1 hypothetical protein EnteroDNA1_00547 [Enterobacter sp. HK169]MBL5946811.1 DUF2975 domain-containing protein [Enterobacter asburiae]MBS0843296.1 DUF2975 domain-containing protein [Enterobacter asburiae]TDV78407.1 Protein of unknown function (DUF2975) [Enterobacter asburiae]